MPGRTGPRPEPVEVAKAKGTYKPYRHGTTPTLIGGRLVDDVKAPRHLNARAKKAWKELADELLPSGILDAADLPGLEMAAISLATAREADAMIKKEGLIVEGPHGTKAHPAIGIRKDASREYQTWCARYGLTPSDRAGLGRAVVQTKTMASEMVDKLGDKVA